ncbi:BnaA09g16730D [Brassica napus]|uniref:(rape) hypothetical protein n=2 Tax=Brassica napus TaxID=3708 RepID=A0A078FJI7_BRANA|nr:unnamed protein product [Brassica napus]CDY13144.1 BnaA09g16730D [Brassica napus]
MKNMSSLIFSTKDVVRTSVLSTRWRNLSQRVVGLDLKSRHFQNFNHGFRSCPNEATLEKLISGSFVLEDLKILRYSVKGSKGLKVRSRTLKRLHLYTYYNVLIEAPLLQCLKTDVNLTNQFKIIHSGFLDKVDIFFFGVPGGRRVICDILTDMSMVSDLFIRCTFWEVYLSTSEHFILPSSCSLISS